MSHITNLSKLDHSYILTSLDDAFDEHHAEWAHNLNQLDALRCIAGSLRSIEFAMSSIAASLAAHHYGDMYPD